MLNDTGHYHYNYHVVNEKYKDYSYDLNKVTVCKENPKFIEIYDNLYNSIKDEETGGPLPVGWCNFVTLNTYFGINLNYSFCGYDAYTDRLDLYTVSTPTNTFFVDNENFAKFIELLSKQK